MRNPKFDFLGFFDNSSYDYDFLFKTYIEKINNIEKSETISNKENMKRCSILTDLYQSIFDSHENSMFKAFNRIFKNGKFKVVENISTEGNDIFQFIYKATAEDGSEYTIFPSGADGDVDNGMMDGGKNAVLNLA